jgi:hypothetical protein
MKKLIRKYLESKTNKEEKEKLFSWLEHQKEDITVFLKKEIEIYAKETASIKDLDAKIAFEDFKKEIIKRKQTKPVLQLLKSFYKYAAAILLIISSYFFYETIFLKQKTESTLIKEALNTIEVEESEIILTQADGIKKVVKQGQEEISYLKNTAQEEKLVYNEIKIPKGKVFKLILSDSTEVWLNSGSKLKYPKTFIKGLANRKVELEGEAFFKVSHNKKMPFIVNSKNLRVEVLGTEFNISSYIEEKNSTTTLVKGSVKVKNRSHKTSASLLLTPSHQAIYNKDNDAMTSKKVNTIEFTSWMQKKIIFNNTPFKDLVKRIERTFNVIVVNNNNSIKEELFTGHFDDESIDVIFKSLSASFKFNYTINENIITIKP